MSVADESKGAVNQGEVRGDHALEAVRVETHRARDVVEGRDRDGWAVTECQVLGGLEVREGSLETIAVARDGQGLGDVRHLHAHGLQQWVVDNGDTGDLLQVDAIERRQEGILDVDSVCLSNAACEAELLEVGQSLEVQVADGGELRPIQGGQNLAVVEREGTANLLDAVRAEGGDVWCIHNRDVTRNCPHTSNVDVVCCASGHGDAAGEGCARGEGRRVALVLDGRGAGDAALCCGWRYRVSIVMTGRRATSIVTAMRLNGQLTSYGADDREGREQLFQRH